MIHDKGVKVEVIEYLNKIPSKEELKEVLKLLKLNPEDIIRKGEADYKDNFKGKNLSDEEWISAMIKYPKLIERPIVIKGNNAVLGRPPENVLELL